MPKTYKPRADMGQALIDVAKAVNYVKLMWAESDRRQKIKDTLPQLRNLWKAARDGEDPVMLQRFVTAFNANKYLYGTEIVCNRQYIHFENGTTGYVFVVTYRHYH
jgi:hypothetical protein